MDEAGGDAAHPGKKVRLARRDLDHLYAASSAWNRNKGDGMDAARSLIGN